MENLEIWKKVAQPPKEALREIKDGRLKGKSDINPQWRIKAMTEIFGPCGIGWKYVVTRKWSEPGAGVEIFAFADVDLFYRDKAGGGWSEAIPGTGGSKLVAQETRGPHSSDEGYKMAVTDALSVAMKSLGVAADVYMGLWDGSKYAQSTLSVPDTISAEQATELARLITRKGVDFEKFLAFFKIDALEKMVAAQYLRAYNMLMDKPDPAPEPLPTTYEIEVPNA